MTRLDRILLLLAAAAPGAVGFALVFVAATRPWDDRKWFPGSIVIGALALLMLVVTVLILSLLREDRS